MKITFISDTHTKHDEMTKDLPGGSILVHCGDVSSRGSKSEIKEFFDWFTSLPYEHKILIAGNHDFGFQKGNIDIPEGVHYLQDSEVIIEGIKFYGTPWQPWFYDWAFNLPIGGQELKDKFELIPDDTDILITHTPPKGFLDRVIRGNQSVGCEILRDRILKISPKINSFGHIHEDYGQIEFNGITFINASLLNHRYEYTNKPIVIDFKI